MIRRALLFLGLLAAGCEREHESDPAAATQSFFRQLAGNRVDAAFREAAFFFQHEQTSRDFEASVYEMGLDGCALVKTETPVAAGKSAKQHVEIRTRFGAQVPLVITLTRDTWADTLARMATQGHFVLGAACYVLSLFVWILGLSRVPVSIAYPLLSIGYIVNAIAAHYLFGEDVNTTRWLGIGFIVVGVWLVAKS